MTWPPNTRCQPTCGLVPRKRLVSSPRDRAFRGARSAPSDHSSQPALNALDAGKRNRLVRETMTQRATKSWCLGGPERACAALALAGRQALRPSGDTHRPEAIREPPRIARTAGLRRSPPRRGACSRRWVCGTRSRPMRSRCSGSWSPMPEGSRCCAAGASAIRGKRQRAAVGLYGREPASRRGILNAARQPAHHSSCAETRSLLDIRPGLVTLETERQALSRCSWWSPPMDEIHRRATRPTSGPRLGLRPERRSSPTVAHEMPHEGRAEEHFLPPGRSPSCRCPAIARRWCGRRRARGAARIMGLDDAEFLAELCASASAIASRRGPAISGAAWLSLSYVSSPSLYRARGWRCSAMPRMWCIRSPGWASISACAMRRRSPKRVAKATSAWGFDYGRPEVLQEYERWRRFDTVMTALATDGLNRLFANDDAILRPLRDAGLRAVNALRPLKDLFVREAAGRPAGCRN